MCYLLLFCVIVLLLSVMYINHPDSDKDNLIIAYVTLARKFPVTAFVAVSLFKEVS